LEVQLALLYGVRQIFIALNELRAVFGVGKNGSYSFTRRRINAIRQLSFSNHWAGKADNNHQAQGQDCDWKYNIIMRHNLWISNILWRVINVWLTVLHNYCSNWGSSYVLIQTTAALYILQPGFFLSLLKSIKCLRTALIVSIDYRWNDKDNDILFCYYQHKDYRDFVCFGLPPSSFSLFRQCIFYQQNQLDVLILWLNFHSDATWLSFKLRKI
jgi:hypothetical protein